MCRASWQDADSDGCDCCDDWAWEDDELETLSGEDRVLDDIICGCVEEGMILAIAQVEPEELCWSGRTEHLPLRFRAHFPCDFSFAPEPSPTPAQSDVAAVAEEASLAKDDAEMDVAVGDDAAPASAASVVGVEDFALVSATPFLDTMEGRMVYEEGTAGPADHGASPKQVKKGKKRGVAKNVSRGQAENDQPSSSKNPLTARQVRMMANKEAAAAAQAFRVAQRAKRCRAWERGTCDGIGCSRGEHTCSHCLDSTHKTKDHCMVSRSPSDGPSSPGHQVANAA